jgi:hypothetical protein
VKTIPFAQLFSTNGDGTGTFDFIGDYSTTGVDAYVSATPSSRTIEIHRFMVFIQDSPNMRAEYYGNLAGPLTNGLTLSVETSGGPVSTYPGTIKSNADWASLAYDCDIKAWGAGDEMLVTRFSFFKLGAALHIENGDKLNFHLNDDFTGLVHHRFLAQGRFLRL